MHESGIQPKSLDAGSFNKKYTNQNGYLVYRIMFLEFKVGTFAFCSGVVKYDPVC